MINLLPPAEKEKLYQRLSARHINGLATVIVGILLGGAVFVFNTFIFLKIQTSSLKQTLNVEAVNIDTQQAQILEEKTKNLNNLILASQNFKQASKMPLVVFQEIEKIVPSGAQVTLVSWEDTAGKIVLSGKAQTRDDVLALEKHLKDSLFFEKIDSPLSNFLEKNNANFTFTFYFKS